MRCLNYRRRINHIVEGKSKALKELRGIEDKILYGLTKNEQISKMKAYYYYRGLNKTSTEINQRMKNQRYWERNWLKIEKTSVQLHIEHHFYSFELLIYQLLIQCIKTRCNGSSNCLKTQWLITTFCRSSSENTKLNDYFTLSLYENFWRGLFEEHTIKPLSSPPHEIRKILVVKKI